MPANFDRIARPYRWLEYLSFGVMLERCHFYRLPELSIARRALVLGDGDGRFLVRLLKHNSQLHADVVDLNPAMLRLLSARAAAAGVGNRITPHCSDAQRFTPSGTYDLVVTHFFLDCFTTAELGDLVKRIQPHLRPDACWVVSEFDIPRGLLSLPAKLVVRGLYAAFHLLTGLGIRRLPDYRTALGLSGLVLVRRRRWLGGQLVSELWVAQGNQPGSRRLP